MVNIYIFVINCGAKTLKKNYTPTTLGKEDPTLSAIKAVETKLGTVEQATYPVLIFEFSSSIYINKKVFKPSYIHTIVCN